MSSTINNKDENLNTSLMVLTIDIGNGTCDKLRIHNINKKRHIIFAPKIIWILTQ